MVSLTQPITLDRPWNSTAATSPDAANASAWQSVVDMLTTPTGGMAGASTPAEYGAKAITSAQNSRDAGAREAALLAHQAQVGQQMQQERFGLAGMMSPYTPQTQIPVGIAMRGLGGQITNPATQFNQVRF